MPLPRSCRKCGKRFQPKTKYHWVCDECQKNVKSVNFIKMICHRNNVSLNKLNKYW